jgi:2-succinyl-5-enolpyruvyl-6-hydroxy-3-cyclohexene-1-carboxylate synthase
VDEWIRIGVRHAVLSPGSRSTPMAVALSERTEISLHVFHDERSGSFAALGIGQHDGVPAILLCTSGTAAVQFHAAVVEADHAHVPMLVCTADRPPELQGVGAPQTINQTNLYGSSTRLFIDAGIADDRHSSKWRAIARDSFSAAMDINPGPVQINLPFREPLIGEVQALPANDAGAIVKQGRLSPSASERKALNKLLSATRGVIVAGAGVDQPRFVFELAQTLQWPIIADQRSGCRVPASVGQEAVIISTADVMLRDVATAMQLKPEVILRIGDPPVSKVVNAWLNDCGATYCAISTTPALIDPDNRVQLHIVGTPSQICIEIVRGTTNRTDQSWLGEWKRRESIARPTIDKELAASKEITEPYVASRVLSALPMDSNLVLSSSMPIRDVEWFATPRDGVKVFANRGVNGIDGVVSTAVGVALASRKPTALLIGDIAMMHDINGLINVTDREIDLRIVIIDNNGGGIFSFLPQSSSLDKDRFELLFGTPHNTDFVSLLAGHRVECVVAETRSQFDSAIERSGLAAVLVRTQREGNVVEHARLNAAVAAALTGG